MNILIIAALLLSGCAKSPNKRHLLKSVSILSQDNMNNNSVVIVDLVQVFNQELWKSLSKMKGNEYFQKKQSIATYNSQHVKIWSFEPIPQTKMQSFCITNWKPRCFGAIVFVSYNSNKQNSFILPPITKNLYISLGADSLKSASSSNNSTKNLIRRLPDLGEPS